MVLSCVPRAIQDCTGYFAYFLQAECEPFTKSKSLVDCVRSLAIAYTLLTFQLYPTAPEKCEMRQKARL